MGKFFDQFPEIDSAVGTELNGKKFSIQRVVGIDRIHFQSKFFDPISDHCHIIFGFDAVFIRLIFLRLACHPQNLRQIFDAGSHARGGKFRPDSADILIKIPAEHTPVTAFQCQFFRAAHLKRCAVFQFDCPDFFHISLPQYY